MKTTIKFFAVSAALAFSSLAQAGFARSELTDAISEDIRSNGEYTLQTVNDNLNVEYWLYDRFAMLRFSAESINYVFYKPFINISDNNFLHANYSDNNVYTSFYDDIGVYEFYTFHESVEYIDYVYQIDEGYTFTGLDFDNKSVFDDAVFTHDYETMYFDEFKVAGLNFDLADAGSVDVPEPSSLGIFALAGLLAAGRKFNKKK